MMPDAIIMEEIYGHMRTPPILQPSAACASQANLTTHDLIGKPVRWFTTVATAFWGPGEEKRKFKTSQGLISNKHTLHIDEHLTSFRSCAFQQKV